MKIYNRYIITIAVLLLLTTVVLTAVGIKAIDLYASAYVIEALVVTELYVHFNTNARRGLNLVSMALFAGFLYMVGRLAFRTL